MDKLDSTFWYVFGCSRYKTDVRQITVLVHVGGESLETIYNAKRDAAVEKKDEKYVSIVKTLNEYFEPRKHSEAETLEFRSLAQNQGEGTDAFLVRLKTQAMLCDFKTDIEYQMNLQIMSGCADKRVKLKAIDEVMSFEAVVKYAQSCEFSGKVVNSGI